jgi:flagellar protein FlaJ
MKTENPRKTEQKNPQESSVLEKERKELDSNKRKTVLEGSLSLAYQLIGDKNARFLPLFRDLDTSLEKSGMRANFKAYVSLTLLVSLLVMMPIAVTTILLSFFVFQTPLVPAILFGVGGALLGWAFCVIGFYLFPVYLADKHKRELDEELPFTVGYMAILASAGVSPEKMFHSLSTLNAPVAASSEAGEITKNVSLFGLDIISALEKTSAKTPSKKLREVIEGTISVIHTGGNLSGFLREKFKMHMKLKRMSLKKYSDNLSVLSEVYVALLLTGPLLLVIMLSVMSMLGSGGFGIFSSELLLNLVTYMGVPVCAVMFLIILDSTSPKW